MNKLDKTQKDLIDLYERSLEDVCADGWVPVSSQLWPYISSTANIEFFELHEQKIRLTEVGKSLVDAVNLLRKYSF